MSKRKGNGLPHEAENWTLLNKDEDISSKYHRYLPFTQKIGDSVLVLVHGKDMGENVWKRGMDPGYCNSSLIGISVSG